MGDRVILHSDINCCYASIEHLHHPELAGKPLAVGGDPEARHGIVLTADYIAKKYGVKTGMALWQAKQVCPDITFVSPRMDLYLRFSRMAHEIYAEYTDRQEPYGIDECWLDVTGSSSLKGDGLLIAQEISRRMKSELTNLMSNAIKYTPEGGTVHFTMECLKHENGIDYDVFEVEDTGIGMSRDFIRHQIFQPYAQENNCLTGKYAGPGLGLAITKSLVELMHGRIEVKSELNEGTVFRVYLAIPIATMEKVEEEEQRKNQKRITAEKKLNQKTILLCEDHPLNAEIGKRLLEKVGCNVIVAKDGEEGITYFANAKPFSIDAVLMDIKMPKVDGMQATVAIRNMERPDAKTVPIIAMTANAFEEDKKASKEAGMNEHLAKPVVPATLYETLEQYIQ